jgi:hypothetical protein
MFLKIEKLYLAQFDPVIKIRIKSEIFYWERNYGIFLTLTGSFS